MRKDLLLNYPKQEEQVTEHFPCLREGSYTDPQPREPSEGRVRGAEQEGGLRPKKVWAWVVA